MVRSLLLAVSPPVLLSLEERGVGSALLMCWSPQLLHPPHHLHLQLFRLVCFSDILINEEALPPTGLCFRSITSNRFVLNMVWGHHLQLRSCPSLFHDFWCFYVKVVTAYYPVIQKEVDELLAEGAIEPSSGGAGFYSSVFVVPKHTGGLQPMLNLKWFNHYMYIPSFKMPTIKHVWQLIQHGDYAFPIDLQDAYLHIPIVKHHHLSYILFGIMYLISGRFYLLGLPQSLGFLCPSPNLFCSFAIARVCILLSIWMISWCLFTLSRWVREHACFCVPCWFTLVYISIFPSMTFTSPRPFVSWGYVGILCTCQYLGS